MEALTVTLPVCLTQDIPSQEEEEGEEGEGEQKMPGTCWIWMGQERVEATVQEGGREEGGREERGTEGEREEGRREGARKGGRKGGRKEGGRDRKREYEYVREG